MSSPELKLPDDAVAEVETTPHVANGALQHVQVVRKSLERNLESNARHPRFLYACLENFLEQHPRFDDLLTRQDWEVLLHQYDSWSRQEGFASIPSLMGAAVEIMTYALLRGALDSAMARHAELTLYERPPHSLVPLLSGEGRGKEASYSLVTDATGRNCRLLSADGVCVTEYDAVVLSGDESLFFVDATAHIDDVQQKLKGDFTRHYDFHSPRGKRSARADREHQKWLKHTATGGSTPTPFPTIRERIAAQGFQTEKVHIALGNSEEDRGNLTPRYKDYGNNMHLIHLPLLHRFATKMSHAAQNAIEYGGRQYALFLYYLRLPYVPPNGEQKQDAGNLDV